MNMNAATYSVARCCALLFNFIIHCKIEHSQMVQRWRRRQQQKASSIPHHPCWASVPITRPRGTEVPLPRRQQHPPQRKNEQRTAALVAAVDYRPKTSPELKGLRPTLLQACSESSSRSGAGDVMGPEPRIPLRSEITYGATNVLPMVDGNGVCTQGKVFRGRGLRETSSTFLTKIPKLQARASSIPS